MMFIYKVATVKTAFRNRKSKITIKKAKIRTLLIREKVVMQCNDNDNDPTIGMMQRTQSKNKRMKTRKSFTFSLDLFLLSIHFCLPFLISLLRLLYN